MLVLHFRAFGVSKSSGPNFLFKKNVYVYTWTLDVLALWAYKPVGQNLKREGHPGSRETERERYIYICIYIYNYSSPHSSDPKTRALDILRNRERGNEPRATPMVASKRCKKRIRV